MCGRYAFILPPDAMLALFKMLNQLVYPPRYNIAPTQPIPVVWEQEGRRTAQLVRWGLVPGWVKDPRDFPLLINARAETMAETPAFRDALRNQRCVIPASGYYEWKKHSDGSRQPYYITMADGSPMAFAGLYTSWMGPNGEEIDTAAIVTVPPNAEISAIYDRMPAILKDEAAMDTWLSRAASARAAAPLARTAPAGTLRYHPVSKAIGPATAEGPELIEAIEVTEAVEPEKRVAGAGGRQLDLF